jgi:polyferredoxin
MAARVGLYTSENALNGKKTTLVKPKSIGYGVILTAATSLLIWSVVTRAPYTGTVEQIRQPLYTQTVGWQYPQ